MFVIHYVFICKLRLLYVGPAVMEYAFMSVPSHLVGPQMKFGGMFHPIVFSPARIPDLNVVKYTDDGQ